MGLTRRGSLVPGGLPHHSTRLLTVDVALVHDFDDPYAARIGKILGLRQNLIRERVTLPSLSLLRNALLTLARKVGIQERVELAEIDAKTRKPKVVSLQLKNFRMEYSLPTSSKIRRPLTGPDSGCAYVHYSKLDLQDEDVSDELDSYEWELEKITEDSLPAVQTLEDVCFPDMHVEGDAVTVAVLVIDTNSIEYVPIKS